MRKNAEKVLSPFSERQQSLINYGLSFAGTCVQITTGAVIGQDSKALLFFALKLVIGLTAIRLSGNLVRRRKTSRAREIRVNNISV